MHQLKERLAEWINDVLSPKKLIFNVKDLG